MRLSYILSLSSVALVFFGLAMDAQYKYLKKKEAKKGAIKAQE